MSMYIRTTDRIVPVEIKELDSLRKYIVGKAETIKELLDRIIVVDTHDGGCDPVVLRRFLGDFCLDDWLEDSKRQGNRYKFFGAIWTDKGLIYVAEMNEQEEWVLL